MPSCMQYLRYQFSVCFSDVRWEKFLPKNDCPMFGVYHANKQPFTKILINVSNVLQIEQIRVVFSFSIIQ